MRGMVLVITMGWLLVAPFGVSAQDIQLLPEGQTLISLSVTEKVIVEQDTLTAVLRVERENKDAQVLQREINAAMERALEVSEASEALQVSTGYYSVYQYNNAPQGGRENKYWRGAQSISIEGVDAQSVLELAGKIQEMGFVMNNLSYSLSTKRADEVRDSLMESAIARAQENAERAARAMGKSNVDIATLSIDDAMGYSQPTMMVRAMAMDSVAEKANPVAEAGESEVSLTVRVQAVAK